MHAPLELERLGNHAIEDTNAFFTASMPRMRIPSDKSSVAID